MGADRPPTVDGRDHPSRPAIADEERPLLSDTDSTNVQVQSETAVGTIVAVLLLGEFISNMDATLVMAAAAKVSSEFNQLQDAIWKTERYLRSQTSLALFLLVVCHRMHRQWRCPSTLGRRAVSGMGGAGKMTVGSVIITDIVPRREVATWRAYVNIAMTLGRSVGGPLGGILLDTIGWRWLFLIQVPLVGLAFILVVLQLHMTSDLPKETTTSRIQRVDFLGTALLGTAIVAVIGLLDQGGKSFLWRSWVAAVMGAGGIILFLAFLLVEAYVAREPIFNLRILRRPNVAIGYSIGCLQVTAQLVMMFSIPLYFQVTQRASTTEAGGHLVPAVVGNTLGGLLTGILIRRMGRYKALLILAGLIASVSYALLYARWDGNTGFWESLYIVPGGLGTGIASAAGFVAMTAMLPPEEMAMATAGYMLMLSFAMTAGITASNSVLGLEFQRQLRANIRGPGSETVIHRAMADTNYIAHLTGHLRELSYHLRAPLLPHSWGG
ncbi:hypothetical protein N7492_007908 [Penicillium capsulatum]|uniref:Major facilitator superfamily (MFS) profile domain-containing protein n=1 Tax=Penicillium capsulatum TaxID=69766 RepID=A0A9W9I351_9EURO|nr:hypothetical protein N7492_007908 [Penicillium capsulatum]